MTKKKKLKEKRIKLRVNLDEELKNTKIDLPKQVVVTRNFDFQNPIGWAFIEEKKKGIFAEIHFSSNNKIIEEILKQNKDRYTCGVSGIIKQRDGNEIKEFDLLSVSIQPKIKHDENNSKRNS